jgi:hypothetical protein
VECRHCASLPDDKSIEDFKKFKECVTRLLRCYWHHFAIFVQASQHTPPPHNKYVSGISLCMRSIDRKNDGAWIAFFLKQKTKPLIGSVFLPLASAVRNPQREKKTAISGVVLGGQVLHD